MERHRSESDRSAELRPLPATLAPKRMSSIKSLINDDPFLPIKIAIFSLQFEDSLVEKNPPIELKQPKPAFQLGSGWKRKINREISSPETTHGLVMKSEIGKQKKLNSKFRILNTIKINELLDKNLENFAK